jgi:hypothetical protein
LLRVHTESMGANYLPWEDNWEGESSDDEHDAWMDKWAPPCPLGHRQRLLELLGFRLKAEDCLQLRLALGWRDGICAAIVDEHPDLVYVRTLACRPKDEADDPPDPDCSRNDVDCGCRVYLDAPLGERVVIDVDSGEPLPMLIPRWGTGEPSFYIPRPTGNLWPPEGKTDDAT